MEEKKEEVVVQKGVSFWRICKVAVHRWQVFVPVALAITIIGSVGLICIYNRNSRSYSASFEYDSACLKNEQYADGSAFVYRNMITYDNLKSIVDSDSEKYSSIDLDSIFKNNAVSIGKKVATSTNNNEINYTITISSKYFSSNDQARDFFKDIINSPLATNAATISQGEFDASLKQYDTADTFEKQVNYLLTEANYLVSNYQKILNNSSNISASFASAAQAGLDEVKNIYNSDTVNSFNYQITSYGFVKDYTSQEAKEYPQQKEALLAEKTENNLAISNFNTEIKTLVDMGATAGITAISEQIVKLTSRNAEIDTEVAALDKKINKVNYQNEPYNTFVSNLNAKRTSLGDAVEKYKSVVNEGYVVNSSAIYYRTDIISQSGGINSILCVAISLLVGVVVAGCINLIIDRKDLKD